jgi:hypothetical protein
MAALGKNMYVEKIGNANPQQIFYAPTKNKWLKGRFAEENLLPFARQVTQKTHTSLYKVVKYL